MITWWKTTRPDGTDWRTGVVDHAAAHASGRALPVRSGRGPVPGWGWYHANTSRAGWVGGWPCRLWRVTPVGATAEHLEHAGGIAVVAAASLRVLAEEDPVHALGPGGVAAAAIVDDVGALTPSRAAAAADAWRAMNHPGTTGPAVACRHAAGCALIAGWHAHRWYGVSAVHKAIARAGTGLDHAAVAAARDAATAVLLADLDTGPGLWDRTARDLLAGPWTAAAGAVL